MAGLRRLAEGLRAALTDGARSSSSESQMNIPIENLRSILDNASKHAGVLDAYLAEQDANALGRGERSKLHTARRFAVTLRDSLSQVSRLVNGEDLDVPSLFDARWDAMHDDCRLREAEIFKKIKGVQQAIGTLEPENVRAELQAVLDYINPDQPSRR